MGLVNAKEMLTKAKDGRYAVAQINTNNLEWSKTILDTVQETKSPVIIGVSEGAAKYHGGFKVVMAIIKAYIEEKNITVPVAVHLDHGTFEGCKKAADAGFTSLMYDGSHNPIEQNIAETKEIVALAAQLNLSTEAEVGSIGGEEDGVIGAGEVADPQECATIANLGVDMLAAGINNIHGSYPKDWAGLRFDVLENIRDAINGKPMVLHGGSGIPEDQIKKAIALGVCKVNINSELQWAFHKATREFILSGEDQKGKNFDPRKLLAPGCKAAKEVIIEKLHMTGSYGKAI